MLSLRPGCQPLRSCADSLTRRGDGEISSASRHVLLHASGSRRHRCPRPNARPASGSRMPFGEGRLPSQDRPRVRHDHSSRLPDSTRTRQAPPVTRGHRDLRVRVRPLPGPLRGVLPPRPGDPITPAHASPERRSAHPERGGGLAPRRGRRRDGHRGRGRSGTALHRRGRDDRGARCAFRRSRSPIPASSRSPSPVKPITCRSEATRVFDYAVQ